QQALEMVHHTPAQVVISTMVLADMTGMQLVQKMRAQETESPPGFVLITSQADAEDAKLSSNAADAVLLPKPFDQSQLAEALVAAMSGPSSRTYADLPSKGQDSGKSAGPNDYGRLCVLIVDDSAPARVHIRAVLKELGLMQFVEAADGARAVAAFSSEK